jgi:hypothetical protein
MALNTITLSYLLNDSGGQALKLQCLINQYIIQPQFTQVLLEPNLGCLEKTHEGTIHLTNYKIKRKQSKW